MVHMANVQQLKIQRYHTRPNSLHHPVAIILVRIQVINNLLVQLNQLTYHNNLGKPWVGLHVSNRELAQEAQRRWDQI